MIIDDRDKTQDIAIKFRTRGSNASRFILMEKCMTERSSKVKISSRYEF